MTEPDDETGPDALDSSIDKLGNQMDTLRHVQDLLKSAEQKADVYVEDRHDSAQIHVIIKADEPIDEMRQLARIGLSLQGEKSRADNLEYDLDKNHFKLEKKFRIDR